MALPVVPWAQSLPLSCVSELSLVVNFYVRGSAEVQNFRQPGFAPGSAIALVLDPNSASAPAPGWETLTMSIGRGPDSGLPTIAIAREPDLERTSIAIALAPD